MAVRVYSPNGEPFDISRRELADKLILEDGWTQTPPKETTPKKQKNRRPRKKPKDAESFWLRDADDS